MLRTKQLAFFGTERDRRERSHVKISVSSFLATTIGRKEAAKLNMSMWWSSTRRPRSCLAGALKRKSSFLQPDEVHWVRRVQFFFPISCLQTCAIASRRFSHVSLPMNNGPKTIARMTEWQKQSVNFCIWMGMGTGNCSPKRNQFRSATPEIYLERRYASVCRVCLHTNNAINTLIGAHGYWVRASNAADDRRKYL